MRIGIFGGTFDPIHVGHLIVAEIMLYELGLDRIEFLPAGMPPHKPAHKPATDLDREAMIERSIAPEPRFSLNRVDTQRPGPSYTVETLQILRRNLPGDTELLFLMGQDSLRDFPTWHEPRSIAGLARLGVARRPGVDVTVSDIERAVPEAVGRIQLIDVPLLDISSSDIRERVRTGRPFRFQVAPAVADYILEHGLYQDDQ